MPPNAEHIAVLRVVIREDFSRTLAERLVTDIEFSRRWMNSPPAISQPKLLMSQLLLMRHKTAMEAESMFKRVQERLRRR
jgi:hypothetical protein